MRFKQEIYRQSHPCLVKEKLEFSLCVHGYCCLLAELFSKHSSFTVSVYLHRLKVGGLQGMQLRWNGSLCS